MKYLRRLNSLHTFYVHPNNYKLIVVFCDTDGYLGQAMYQIHTTKYHQNYYRVSPSFCYLFHSFTYTCRDIRNLVFGA